MGRAIGRGLSAGLEPPVARYAEELRRQLTGILEGGLEAAYLIGSVAFGDYVPGRSDLDVLGVCADPLPAEKKRELVGALSHRSPPCPARRLELVLYARGSVAGPGRSPAFELNLNTGPGMQEHASFDPSAEPSHWFVLDIAIARQRAIPLLGPPASQVFGPISRDRVLEALKASLDWHLEHEPLGHNSVLNACRAWRFVEEGRWHSKSEAADWARGRVEDPATIDGAPAARVGDADAPLDPDGVRALVLRVRERVMRR